MPVEEQGLLERARELTRLRELLGSVREGSGAAVVIEGPAGTGKTSLLAAGVVIARQTGMRTMTARAGQLERDLAWNPVRQLFAPTLDAAEPQLLEGAAALAKPALGIAGGNTNREIAEGFFVSLRTVETHLIHAYRKLGIQARSQLPGALSGAAATRVSPAT